MSRRTKPANFDGRLLPEAVPQQDAREKTATTVPDHQAADVDRAHHDARVRDTALEAIQGLTRAARDRDRAYPRPAGAADPRKSPRAPVEDEPRTPPTDYQCRMRSRTKRAAQSRLRRTEYDALNRLVTDEDHWVELNDRLSDTYTAGVDLTIADRVHVQRIDRAIRRYEELNDRGHRVYVPLALPDVDALTPAETEAWVSDHIASGDRYTFDQFTAADHDPHKAAAQQTPVLLEITGSRGIYLGGPQGSGDTSHLLPRGLQLEVTGTTVATIQGPREQELRRPVISLRVVNQKEDTDGLHR